MSRRLLPLALLLPLVAACAGPVPITTCTSSQPSLQNVDLLQEVANIGDWAALSPRSCRPLVRVYARQVESVLSPSDGLDGQETRRYLDELRQDCLAHRYGDVKATGELMLAWARARGKAPN